MTEYARLVVAVDSTQVSRADAALDKFERTTISVERQTNSLAGAFSRLKGPLVAVTAGLSVKGVIDMADNYGQMADRIRMATSSTEEYRQVQDRLLQSANNTYRPLVEAQELFIRTADTLRSLGNETGDVLDITDSFSYLLVTNAASADRATSAIDAYSKSIQTGKIDSDAWQSILAAMPSIVETLARETGKSSEEIRKLGVSGKLSLTDLNEGLRLSVDANKALADGMGTTLNDAIVRARNNLSAYLGESGAVTGSSQALSGALDLVSGNLDKVAGVMGGVAAGGAVMYASKLLAQAKSAVAARTANIAQAEAALKAAQANQYAAEMAQRSAKVELEKARADIVSAKAVVEKSRAQQAAELERLRAVQAALAAENALEQQRFRSQITDQGRAATTARMAELRTAETAIIKQVQAAEAALAATTVATSAEVQAAYARRTAAVAGYTEASTAASAATARLATAHAGLRTASAGLLATFGGPVGLAVLAGSAAASYLLFRDATEEVRQSSIDLSGPLDQMIEKWGKLDKMQRSTLSRDLNTKIGETTDEMQREAEKVEAAFYKLGNAKGLPIESWLMPLKDFRQAVADGGADMFDFTQQLLEGVPANSQYRKTVEDAATAIATKAGRLKELQEALEKLNKLEETNNDVVAKSPDGVLKQVTALELQAKTAGMASDQAILYKLAQEGAVDADLKRAEAALKVVGALEAEAKAIQEQQRLNADATSIIESLQTEEEQIRASYDRRREIILSSSIHAAEEKREALLRLDEETNEALLRSSDYFLDRWLVSAENALTSLDDLALSVINDFTRRWGDAFETMIFDAESLEDAAKGMAEGIARSVVNATGQMLAQWAVYSIAQQAMAASANAAAVAQSAATGAAIATAYAPAAAAASLATVGGNSAPAIAGMSAASAFAMGPLIAGMAHDGLDYVPREGTWLLDKGERVVDRRTNADLKEFLSSGGGTGAALPPISIEINIEGNADEGTANQLQESAREIATMVRNEIMQDVHRNGPIIKAIRGKV